MIDNIFENARRLIDSRLIEHYFGAEGAYWKSGEFWTFNPLRNDNHINSFSISEKGLYKDFSYDEYKGDFIDLVSKAFGLTLKAAAEKIITDSGGNIPEGKYKEHNKTEKPEFIGIKIEDRKKEVELRHLLKEKAEASYNLKDKNNNQYELVKFYTYREYKTGFLLYYIARYECKELKDKNEKYKKFHPFSFGIDGKIYQKLPDNFKPFPLYNINKTIGNDFPVIIVEGEKCADIPIENYRLVTFSGGSGNINSFDFTTLRKKKIYIWPDNDEPGKKTAEKIKDKLPKSEIFNIDILSRPIKWDIADAYNSGENIEEIILQLIAEIESRNKKEIQYDPEHAADLFLKERFQYYNLEQIDGIFWRYLPEHYWERILFENIKSDIQIFLKENGYFKQAEIDNKKKTSFKNDVISFIKDHSQGYFEINPFLKSALSPFIHFSNGAIHLSDDGYKFISRDEKNENYFRKLYPLSCFEFKYLSELQDRINYENIKTEAPTFYYFVKNIIPIEKQETELNSTIRFTCQMIAYCMSPIKKEPYFFVFYGDENTSKTSLFKLVKTFIGDKFIVSRSIKEIEDSRFGTSDMWGAKIFADEDMDDDAMIPGGFIKRLSGEINTTIERKHENSQKGVDLSIAMFFISNFKPRAYGIEGVKRRAIMIKFENKVPAKPDGDLMERIAGRKPHNHLTPESDGKKFDEREIILHLILHEWKNITNNNYKIELPDWIQQSTNKILSEMTSSGEYIQVASNGDRPEIETEKIYVIEDIYKDYKDWCKDEGRQPKSKGKFEEEILRDKLRVDSSVRTSNRRSGVYKIKYLSIDSEIKQDKNSDEMEIPF